MPRRKWATTPERSRIMRAIGSRSSLEDWVARATRGLGLRRNVRGLPGTPDLACRERRVAVFVHGCFWHRHSCRPRKTIRSNAALWREKFRRNVERDRLATRRLRARGFRVLVLWECSLEDRNEVRDRVLRFLNRTKENRR